MTKEKTVAESIAAQHDILSQAVLDNYTTSKPWFAKNVFCVVNVKEYPSFKFFVQFYKANGIKDFLKSQGFQYVYKLHCFEKSYTDIQNVKEVIGGYNTVHNSSNMSPKDIERWVRIA